MNNGAKVVLAVGTVILLLGIGLMVKAGPSATIEELDPVPVALWRESSADQETLTLDPDMDFEAYLQGDGELNSISILDSLGREIFHYGPCEQDSLQKEGCDDDWIELGYFSTTDCPCQISLNATEDVIISEYGRAGGHSNVDEWLSTFCFGVIAICFGVLVLAGGGGWGLLAGKKKVELQPQQQFEPLGDQPNYPS
jgi:hypothetical protein